MSNTQYVFLKKDRLPARAALQASIDALAVDFKLDPELDLLNDTGYSPGLLGGEEAGFELFTEETADVVEDDEEFQALAGDKDLCIGMSWGGSMKDCAAVMIVSCALAKDYGAVVSYEGEEPEPLEDMLASLPALIADAMKERRKR